MKNFCYLKLADLTECEHDFETSPFCKHCGWNMEEDERRRRDIRQKGLKSKYSAWQMKTPE